MAQTTFSVRMDRELKRDFADFCENVGMSMSTAFVVFAKATLREKRFPFSIGVAAENGNDGRERALRAFAALRRNAESRDCEEMPMEEINREIAAVRVEMRKRD